MYIHNFTAKDLPLDINGTYVMLTANADTLVPDGIVTADELKKLFDTRVQVVTTSSATTSQLALQQVVSAGKLYSTEPISDEFIRLFVGVSGTVNVYGSDSITPPASLSVMACPDENKNVTGMSDFQIVPRYLAFKNVTGTPEIVIFGCKLHEVSSIS